VKHDGFTIVELLIAAAISMAVVGAVLATVNPLQTMVRAQGDAIDMHQRLRAVADMLAGDLRAASSVRPYRVGAVRDDSAAGVFYRPDTIAVIGDATTTYYFKRDTLQLMQYDGGRSDLPVVDHVAGLAFGYFGPAAAAGTALVRFDPTIFLDGPWIEDASHRRFDADLLRVSEVRIALRLEAPAASLRQLVPDETFVLHVALRNSPVAR